MKHIWLTGASSGIGAALAQRFLSQGHQLAVSARNVQALKNLHLQYPEQVLVLPGDLTDPQQVQAMGKQIELAWGALDQVVLNAGTCEYLDAACFEANMIERVMRANFFSATYCVQAALPLLRQAQRPHLVAVCSSVTYLALPRAEAYGASKAAMRYLFQSLRIDLAQEDIDVTLVSPGFVDTPLTQQNDFPMPMRWTANKAAAHIVARLEKRPMEIAFPWPFIGALRLLALLPQRLQLALVKRMARTATEQPS
ncbi:SDR family oxidoreductase [Pseudomonas sp. BBP2017]|uniref:SDR family NAD(P)-dependent oxidoreductase n=1 Tax=Pseudomonas sp. BBP2017 TaxID=2109731 RepID=UPI000D116707|nr:SDR family NAD(P)-dependent oxidoreductase [Pseudomonas sp. BBP2017]PSS58754.1 short-chain dehydrogenase [Pseudomonas sp. BBP2017]